MKKSILLAAGLSMLLGSCTNNGVVNNGQVTPDNAPIAFNQYTEKVTKAAITNEASLAEAGGFAVFGYKNELAADNWTDAQTIFNGVNVYKSQSSTTDTIKWMYDNLRFWDKTATYHFFAVAPYEATPAYGIGTDKTKGYFTINGVASAVSTESKDYIITRGPKSQDGTNQNTVELEFHHIMTKVDVKLKSTLSADDGTIKVTKLQLTGWNAGAGKFVQNATTTPTTLNKDEWTIETAAAGNVTLIKTAESSTHKTIACGGTDIKDVDAWYIMVPQVLSTSDDNKLTFTVDYEFTQGDYTETFTNQKVEIGEHTWGTDSHITYTLNIKPNAIEFDVTQICGFHVIDNGSNQPGEIQ